MPLLGGGHQRVAVRQALGRALGKAKRAIADATADEPEPVQQAPAISAADVRVERPVEGLPEKTATAEPSRQKPKTYAPAPKGAGTTKSAAKQAPKPAAKPRPKSASTGDKVAKAAGKQLGSFGKMFGSFKDEFNKASK